MKSRNDGQDGQSKPSKGTIFDRWERTVEPSPEDEERIPADRALGLFKKGSERISNVKRWPEPESN